jgi:hypothetical protein
VSFISENCVLSFESAATRPYRAARFPHFAPQLRSLKAISPLVGISASCKFLFSPKGSGVFHQRSATFPKHRVIQETLLPLLHARREREKGGKKKRTEISKKKKSHAPLGSRSCSLPPRGPVPCHRRNRRDLRVRACKDDVNRYPSRIGWTGDDIVRRAVLLIVVALRRLAGPSRPSTNRIFTGRKKNAILDSRSDKQCRAPSVRPCACARL